jgi:hypothetical protein
MSIESLSVFIVMGPFDNFPPQARHPKMIPQATVSRKNDLNFIIVVGYAMKNTLGMGLCVQVGSAY